MLSQTQKPGIALIYRDPFCLKSPRFETWSEKRSISEIIALADWLPSDFAQVGTVSLNGHVVPRDLWAKVYPRPSEVGTDLIFQVAVQGGKQGGAKQIFAFVAALALVFVTQGIAGGSLAKFLGAKFAAGTAGARLAAAGVSIVGGLAVNALSSVPVSGASVVGSDQTATTLNPASVRGNVLQQNAAIPAVIGTRKIFPPFLAEPIVEMVGQDEIITAILGLAGPHKLETIRVGDALASDAGTDLSILTYDGLPESPKIDIPDRYGKTFTIGAEMSTHGVKASDGANYAGPLPIWHSFSTAENPNESWLHLYIAGLVKDDISTEALRIPFRIRMKLRGASTWRELPEFHYKDNSQSQKRIQIKFMFGEAFGAGLPVPPATNGWVEARKTVPLSGGGSWACDSYFSAGSGNDVYKDGTQATTNLRNILLIDNTMYVWLDAADWTPGIYDVQIIRGATFRDSQFVSSSYELNGSIQDFYDVPPGDLMPLSRSGLIDRVTLVRCVNIRYQQPINEKNLALIYITAKNREVDETSVVASGYVRDYDGTKWGSMITTSNPAPHFRNILTGSLNSDPLPEVMLWEQSLIEWRQFCIDEDLTCDLILEGGSIFEILRIIASCGFASPYQSEIWGVIIDKDRSDEPPEQTFTPRNSNNYSVRKMFNRLAAGLRPNYKDQDYEYTGKQIIVYADDANSSDALTEQVEYLGIVKRSKIERRAKIDLRQARMRAALHSFNTNIASLAIRRGSLIAVANDVIMQYQNQSARITSVTLGGSGFVTEITIDSPVTIYDEADLYDVSDFYLTDDVYLIGMISGIAIRNSLGVLTRHRVDMVTGETSTITLLEPIEIDPDKYKPGNLVIVGTIEREYRRLIVTDIQYTEKKIATITAVDEAPEIWS